MVPIQCRSVLGKSVLKVRLTPEKARTFPKMRDRLKGKQINIFALGARGDAVTRIQSRDGKAWRRRSFLLLLTGLTFFPLKLKADVHGIESFSEMPSTPGIGFPILGKLSNPSNLS